MKLYIFATKRYSHDFQSIEIDLEAGKAQYHSNESKYALSVEEAFERFGSILRWAAEVGWATLSINGGDRLRVAGYAPGEERA